MCFSAQASFLAGTGLSGFGIYILQSVKQQKIIPLKAIPLLFGIQQLCEGVVWITQGTPEHLLYNQIGRYGFLFFALIIWPIWIPYSLYQLVEDEKRKRCMASFLGIGATVSSGLGWILFNQGATALISCNHIEYLVNVPEIFLGISITWYCIATILPFFIMKKAEFKQFGMLLLGSVLITIIFFYAWFTSVWCFFSALLSVFIYKIK